MSLPAVGAIESVKMTTIERNEFSTTLANHVGGRVQLNCQVGVCIFGAMMTLENGHGLCQWDCVSGEIRIGIGAHCIHQLRKHMDGTLDIYVA